MTEEEQKKWGIFNKREDVAFHRAKAQLARNAYAMCDVYFHENCLIKLAKEEGLCKQ